MQNHEKISGNAQSGSPSAPFSPKFEVNQAGEGIQPMATAQSGGNASSTSRFEYSFTGIRSNLQKMAPDG